MKQKIEFIGGPIDGTTDKVEDRIQTVEVPEMYSAWDESPISTHVYKRSAIPGDFRFYYKGKDGPEEVKRKIIEGME